MVIAEFHSREVAEKFMELMGQDKTGRILELVCYFPGTYRIIWEGMHETK